MKRHYFQALEEERKHVLLRLLKGVMRVTRAREINDQQRGEKIYPNEARNRRRDESLEKKGGPAGPAEKESRRFA